MKVLILTANRTGTGHKASANALQNAFAKLGVEAKQLNCFSLMGKVGEKMEDCYIPLTTKHPYIWKIAHDFSDVVPSAIHHKMFKLSENSLLNEIRDYSPDVIISVHCMFTQAVSRLLERHNLKIPFAVVVIDLVNPPKVWRDKKADLIFLPTEQVLNQYTKLKFNPNKLVVSGFPIREDIALPTEAKTYSDKINVLMVNPSVNLKKNKDFVKNVSELDNVNLTVVCGRDEIMYNALMSDKKSGNLKNVNILSFITNMNELLADSQILLTKAGPNMLLEGTRSGTAVIVTGHIPGQESKNYKYITENNLGEVCENPKKIKDVINLMISNGKLNEYLNNCLSSKYNDGANVIANTIIKRFKEKN